MKLPMWKLHGLISDYIDVVVVGIRGVLKERGGYLRAVEVFCHCHCQ
jgi:hypothetical protein